MKVASSLVSGLHPGQELAAAAVSSALAEAGLSRAEQVILLLSREFSRQPQPAILAAARSAGTMQVCGCTANGLFTERGWQIDQPAAAALVFDREAADQNTSDEFTNNELILSFTGHSTLPLTWQTGPARAGLLDSHAATWAHGRQAPLGGSEIYLPGLQTRMAISTGLGRLGKAQRVERAETYELFRVGGHSAVESLRRSLPAALRQHPPLHHVSAQRQPGTPGIAIIAANADGSLTMAAPFEAGEEITWAIRQPLSAEQDMRDTLLAAVDRKKTPNFALMFSCIGRGPLFYGDDDHDLLAFREQFPGLPLLGAYGSGQIAPVAGQNCLFQNSVITLLFESTHV